MDQLYNPVNEFYTNYKFNNLPIVQCSDYEDVLNKAKNVTSSCILYNDLFFLSCSIADDSFTPYFFIYISKSSFFKLYFTKILSK